MIVNDPKTLAEVERECALYERALTVNDVDALNRFFWHDAKAIRYGLAENLYGYAEIAAFRSAHSSAGRESTLSRTVITTFGTEFATASTLFHHKSFGSAMGRRIQTWVKIDDGWRIVAAHVSLMKA